MFKKKLFLTMFLFLAAFVFSGTAMAATSVSWLSPADGSSYTEGTIVNPTGQASGTGTTGGTGLDLALVIDTSGSMGWSISDGQGGTTTGKAAAQEAAIALVNSLPEATTSVAVVGFSSSSFTYRVLTPLLPASNKDAIIAAINGLPASGGTNIGVGVQQGADELVAGHTAGRQMMQVVLSDGVGDYSGQAATAYDDHSIITHAVGVPGHDVTQMQEVATDGHGQYTNVTDLSTLTSLFDGTGGNLVGLDYVDIELPDGTIINNITIDALGNFALPDWVIKLGVNEFTAYAYREGYDPANPAPDTYATAILTLNGINDPGIVDPVPEPATMALFGLGLLGLAGITRRQR